jgi:hypothetical protein
MRGCLLLKDSFPSKADEETEIFYKPSSIVRTLSTCCKVRINHDIQIQDKDYTALCFIYNLGKWWKFAIF